MKRAALSVLLVLMVPLCTLAGTLDHDCIKPYLEVRTSAGLGSGVTLKMVDGQIVVVTAGHVVMSCVHPDTDRVVVFNPAGKANSGVHYDPVTLRQEHAGKIHDRLADILYYSPPEEQGGDDLAILKPRDTAGLVPAHLLDAKQMQPEAGEDAWHVGTPAGLHRSLEKSIINRTDYVIPELRGKTFLLVNMGWFGSSGGPVYVKRGDAYYVVGIIVRAVSDSPKTPAGCETLSTVRNFLSQYKPQRKCPCGPSCPCGPDCKCKPGDCKCKHCPCKPGCPCKPKEKPHECPCCPRKH